MHLPPYLKSQITPSVHDEMNKMKLISIDTGFEIRALAA